MKKIINSQRIPIIVDTDTLQASLIKRAPRAIDNIYVIPDDATIVWKKVDPNLEDRTVDVKKGDIMIVFYDRDCKKDFVIVKGADEWLEAIDNYENALQTRKEEWAAKQKMECEEDCGTNCVKCEL